MCWELDLQDNSGERGDSEEVMRSEGSAPLKQIRVGGGDLSGQWAPDRRRVRGSLSLPPSLPSSHAFLSFSFLLWDD